VSGEAGPFYRYSQSRTGFSCTIVESSFFPYTKQEKLVFSDAKQMFAPLFFCSFVTSFPVENNFFFTSFDFFCEKPFFWTTFLLLYYRGKNKKEKIVV